MEVGVLRGPGYWKPSSGVPGALLGALLVALRGRLPGLLPLGGLLQVQLNPSLHEPAFNKLRPLQGERTMLLVVHGARPDFLGERTAS